MSSSSPTATLTADDGSPVPAHAHDVSSLTADASPATLHAGTFLAELLQFEKYPASEYVVTTAASWDVYLELVKSIDELRSEGTLKSLRCSYLSEVILVEYSPTASHEQGHAGLINIITGTVYTDMALKGEEIVGLFCLLGRTRFQNTGQRRSLEGDSCLALQVTARNGPTLVIECGTTQSYPSLHRKGMSWFDFPNVQVVILVNYQKSSKAVEVEIFQRLAPAALLNAVNTASQLTNNAITHHEVQMARYRTNEAAAGVEIFTSLAFSSSNLHQVATDMLIPYSGLFGHNIPAWAPPGKYWRVHAFVVVRWAKGLIDSME